MKTPGNYFDPAEHIRSVQTRLGRMDTVNTDRFTGKCIHCGDTKKNHAAGLKCRTRLKDTKFQEWTDADRKDVGEPPVEVSYSVFEKIPGKVWRQINEVTAKSGADAIRKTKQSMVQHGNVSPAMTRYKAEVV